MGSSTIPLPRGTQEDDDAVMNVVRIQKAIDFARANPNDPRSKELRRRMEAGLLNNELKQLGKPTFAITPPKIDPSKVNLAEAMRGARPKEGLQSTPSDTVGDLQEGFGELQGVMPNRSEKSAEGMRMMADPKTFGQGGFRVLAQGLGAFIDTASIAAKTAAKMAMSPEQEAQWKRGLDKTMANPAIKGIGELLTGAYEDIKQNDPALAKSIEDAGILAEFLGGASRPVRSAIEASGDAARAVPGALQDGMSAGLRAQDAVTDSVGRTVGPTIDRIRQVRREAQIKDANDAVGRILQGKPEDIEAGKKALSSINTEGVRTYKELNERLNEGIETYSTLVDAELDQYTDRYLPDQFARKTKVGDATVTETPVNNALDGLEKAYKASGDLVAAEEVAQLRAKFETEGLTVREVNTLAREYGIEFKSRAFDKLGNPKQGYDAENFENTRKGVKAAYREKLPDEVTKSLDEQISALYDARTLTENMEVKVNALYQKVKNRTLMQKVGGAAADFIDLVSLGTARGFVQKLLPSNVGLKTANSLDLEKELAKNLKKVERLLAIEEPATFAAEFQKYMDEVQPGLSIRATSGLSDGEKDILLQRLESIDAKSFTVDGQVDQGLLELQERIDFLKQAAERDRGLTEREYIELRELMDEFQFEETRRLRVQEEQ